MSPTDTLLSPEEMEEIRAEATLYPAKSAASVEALKVIQKHRGWVADEPLKAVAELLDMSAAELDGVATFYNLIFRRPVGRKVILCCDSVSCWLMGAERVSRNIGERLGIRPGETSADGQFTLLPICCLGACDRAPALLIDERLYWNVQPETVESILAAETRSAESQPETPSRHG